jgi:hypothetical protein
MAGALSGRALRNDFSALAWPGRPLEATQADEEKSYLGTRPDDFRPASYGPVRASIWAGCAVCRGGDRRIVAEAASVLTRGAALVR